MSGRFLKINSLFLAELYEVSDVMCQLRNVIRMALLHINK